MPLLILTPMILMIKSIHLSSLRRQGLRRGLDSRGAQSFALLRARSVAGRIYLAPKFKKKDFFPRIKFVFDDSLQNNPRQGFKRVHKKWQMDGMQQMQGMKFLETRRRRRRRRKRRGRMSTYELIYFDGRGFGEIIRLVLTACGVEFKDSYLKTREEYLDLKPSLAFGQVPVLVTNGKHLVQSGAIVRHLARTHNLYGKGEEEMALVDAYYEGTRDFLKPFMQAGVSYPFDKTVENTRAIVDKYLPLFEQILKRNESCRFLVGDSLTFADLGLLEVLLYLRDFYEQSVYDGYTELKAFLDAMAGRDFYERYQSEVRKPLHTAEKIENARKVLGH